METGCLALLESDAEGPCCEDWLPEVEVVVEGDAAALGSRLACGQVSAALREDLQRYL